jgi:hypothetical protein
MKKSSLHDLGLMEICAPFEVYLKVYPPVPFYLNSK